MTPSKALAAALIAFVVAPFNSPIASADSEDSSPVADSGNPAVNACTQFDAAQDYVAANYEDFAYATAGGGNIVNYADATVHSSNVVGRTALREAASTVWASSTAPGVPPEIASPMKAWSRHAVKLIFLMGLHGGGDSLNNAASDLNQDAHDSQMACAQVRQQ
jgi:hypothetical protein